jgi:hypothetical protein
MAHFAKLDDNNKVLEVVVIANNAIDPTNEEESGVAFLTQTFGHTMWKQTSFTNSMRKQYAGIGYTYDADADVFITPQPYNSWILDSNHDWQPPTPYPTDGKQYAWFEHNQQWIEIVEP